METLELSEFDESSLDLIKKLASKTFKPSLPIIWPVEESIDAPADESE